MTQQARVAVAASNVSGRTRLNARDWWTFSRKLVVLGLAVLPLCLVGYERFVVIQHKDEFFSVGYSWQLYAIFALAWSYAAFEWWYLPQTLVDLDITGGLKILRGFVLILLPLCAVESFSDYVEITDTRFVSGSIVIDSVFGRTDLAHNNIRSIVLASTEDGAGEELRFTVIGKKIAKRIRVNSVVRASLPQIQQLADANDIETIGF